MGKQALQSASLVGTIPQSAEAQLRRERRVLIGEDLDRFLGRVSVNVGVNVATGKS